MKQIQCPWCRRHHRGELMRPAIGLADAVHRDLYDSDTQSVAICPFCHRPRTRKELREILEQRVREISEQRVQYVIHRARQAY